MTDIELITQMAAALRGLLLAPTSLIAMNQAVLASNNADQRIAAEPDAEPDA